MAREAQSTIQLSHAESHLSLLKVVLCLHRISSSLAWPSLNHSFLLPIARALWPSEYIYIYRPCTGLGIMMQGAIHAGCYPFHAFNHFSLILHNRFLCWFYCPLCLHVPPSSSSPLFLSSSSYSPSYSSSSFYPSSIKLRQRQNNGEVHHLQCRNFKIALIVVHRTPDDDGPFYKQDFFHGS